MCWIDFLSNLEAEIKCWTWPEGSSSEGRDSCGSGRVVHVHHMKLVQCLRLSSSAQTKPNMSSIKCIQSLPYNWLIGQLGKVPDEWLVGHGQSSSFLRGRMRKICVKIPNSLFFFPNPPLLIFFGETLAWASASRPPSTPHKSEAACGRCPRPAKPPALRLLRALPQRSQMMDGQIYGWTDRRLHRAGQLTLWRERENNPGQSNCREGVDCTSRRQNVKAIENGNNSNKIKRLLYLSFAWAKTEPGHPLPKVWGINYSLINIYTDCAASV